MDLTQLEMFNAVAEAGSITQAAAKVHRVPSNLTTRLRQLETELGVDLFIRENQRLRLSPAGHNFLRYSQQILALVDEARSVVAGDEPQGLFSLGSLESTAAVRIPATLAEFNRRYPKIQFSLSKLLPLLPSEHSGSLKSLPLLFRRPALMSIYLLTVVVVTAHYTAYSYIEPFVQNIAGFSANFATALLLLLGGAGIIGSVIFGKLGNQYASALVSTAIALLLVCLALLLPAANSEIHLGVLSIFWGIAMMIIGLGMQVKVLALAPDATDVAMALFSGIFNIGIGAGALVGNQVSLHWSMSMIGYVGAVPAFAALIWSIIIFRRWPVTLEEQTQ